MTKKHTHVRTILKHANGHPYNELNRSTNQHPSIALRHIIMAHTWSSYLQEYSNDSDGDTIYYKFNGIMVDGLRLTAHVFSCYCEPLNENQEPPF